MTTNQPSQIQVPKKMPPIGTHEKAMENAKSIGNHVALLIARRGASKVN